MRYYSSKEIYSRLSSSHRNKIAEFSMDTILRWCAECVTELIPDTDNHIQIIGHNLGKVKNLSVRIPYAVKRILSCYDTKTGSRINYIIKGEYLFVSSENSSSEVSIDYLSCPFDEDGFPYVFEGQEQACEAYCVFKMYYEDYLEGKIDRGRFIDIQMNKENELNAAAASWKNITPEFIRDVMSVMINNGYKAIIK